jgi:nucleotide-binding universal stress UspA family protein
MQETLILPQADLATVRVARVPIAPTKTQTEILPSLSVSRILLPFDLTNSSVCALRAVTRYAEQTGATIYLLHVVRPMEDSDIPPKPHEFDDKIAEASERLLKHWVKRIVQGRVQTFVTIRVGEAVDVILARATAIRAELIVMTSRGCGGLKNEVQRSTAERVSRLAACPVLTVPEKCGEEFAYPDLGDRFSEGQTILMAVDFSTAAERALPVAAAVARKSGAKLLLAHGSDAGDRREEEIHERLRRWADRVLKGRLVCRTSVWPGGHSLYAILSEALRSEAKLIVLPTSARFWAQRWRAGSITDAVLRQAPCPVLSINENMSAAKK